MKKTVYHAINLMLPTRKRIKNGKLPRFINSALGYAKNKQNVFFTFLIDEDDEETIVYLDYLKINQSQIIINREIKSVHLAKFYNILYRKTKFRQKDILVSMVGDDMEFLSENWDSEIIAAANACNGVGIIYGDDCYVQHEKMCVNLFTSRQLVNATKQPFMHPDFAANIIDDIWTIIGRRAGILKYLPQVKIRHHHTASDGDEVRAEINKKKKFTKQVMRVIEPYIETSIQNLRQAGMIQ